MRSLLALAVVAATGSIASAGTYVGLGIGTAPAISGSSQQDQVAMYSDGRSGKILLGTSFGHLAIEGSAGRFGLLINGNAFDSTQLGAALKYSLPLGNQFEAFGRGGLQRTWLTTSTMQPNASGDGFLLGAGFEYRLKLGVTAASVFVDYQIQSGSATTSDQRYTIDSTARMFTLGATFAL